MTRKHISGKRLWSIANGMARFWPCSTLRPNSTSCRGALRHKDTRIGTGFGLDLFLMHPFDSSYGVQGLLSMQLPSMILAMPFIMKTASIAKTGVSCLAVSNQVVLREKLATKDYLSVLATSVSRLPRKVFILKFRYPTQSDWLKDMFC